MEWSPDNIFIYVNDNLAGRYTGKDVPSHPMFLYIDQQIGPAKDSDNLPTLETDNSLPQFFTIDYFRYYYLNCDCSQSVVATDYNFKNDYKVKRKYSLSNTKVPNNEKIKLRAETIELGNNFEITIGTTPSSSKKLKTSSTICSNFPIYNSGCDFIFPMCGIILAPLSFFTPFVDIYTKLNIERNGISIPLYTQAKFTIRFVFFLVN